jgi:hypothetical protein
MQVLVPDYRLHLPGHQYPDEEYHDATGQEPRETCSRKSHHDLRNVDLHQKITDQAEPYRPFYKDRYVSFRSQEMPPMIMILLR